MTPRIAILKPGRHIYTRTEVSIDRTMAEIKKMLVQAGCQRIGTEDDTRGNTPLYSLRFEKDGLPFLIEFPAIYVKTNSSDKLRMDISARIIRDRIKALLIEFEIGASPFSAAMVQFMAIADKKTGRPVSLENYMLEYREDIPAGTLFLPAGGPR